MQEQNHTVCLSKNAIIEKLFTGKNFRDCISKMEPDHLRDDLKQDIILKICELPDEKVMGLYSRGELEFYTTRVIINETRNKYNGFFKRYMVTHVPITEQHLESKGEDDGMDDRETREVLEDFAIEQINSLYWYDAEMIKLYLEHGNYRAIQKVTGIPYVSCYKNIQKSIKLLQSRVFSIPDPLFTKEEIKQIAV